MRARKAPQSDSRPAMLASAASNLRWRARWTREALQPPLQSVDDSRIDPLAPLNHHPKRKKGARGTSDDEEDDDDGDYDDDEDDNDGSTRKSTDSQERRFHRGMRALTLDLMASTAAACSFWTLRVTRTWFMAFACTLSVFMALWTVWQHRALRKWGTWARMYYQIRRTVWSLQQQNERLYRNLTQLDQAYDRVHQVQSELQRIIGNQDQERLIRVTLHLREVQRQLQRRLHQQVQEQVLRAFLQADDNQDLLLSGPELERLILRLQNMPGVHLNERLFRAQIVAATTAAATSVTSSSSSSTRQQQVEATLRILRQFASMADEEPAIASKSRIKTNPNKMGDLAESTAASSSRAMITYAPRELLPSQKSQGLLHEC